MTFGTELFRRESLAAVRRAVLGAMGAMGALVSCGVLAGSAIGEGQKPPLAATVASGSAVANPVFRRLTSVEYTNSLRDLLGIDYPFGADLPADGQSEGFDNIGDALSFSPVLLESYLNAARRAADLAIGQGNLAQVTEIFPVTDTQAKWQEGMPPGTRGGVKVKHFFPRDGEYEMRAFLRDLREIPLPATEGVRFFRARVPVSAGLHTFIVTFPEEYTAREGAMPNLDGPGGLGRGGPVDMSGSTVRPVIDFWLDGKVVRSFEVHSGNPSELSSWTWPGPPVLQRAELTGPFNAGRAADTTIQRQIRDCQSNPGSRSELACAEGILRQIARRAYRRDLTSGDMELILGVFAKARQTKPFDESVGMGLRAIILSSDFLFRIELDPPNAKVGQSYAISDYELASRLSYFLWSTLPDDALLNEARLGRLHTPAVLKREVLRMLSDPRSDEIVDNFATQWLGLREIEAVVPDPKVYPEFDEGLREAFKKETRYFIRSVIRENRSVLDVISANYTFLNEDLAEHYGIRGVKGAAFRKVNLPGNDRRGGLLTQGSVLMVTSHAADTSPILRGKWILTNLLNASPPTPAVVPPFDASQPSDGRKLTMREKLERHRTSPACKGCHVLMDPYGLGLENYDVLGRWRTVDDGGTIDASGTLPSGAQINGITGLKGALLANSNKFVSATVAKLMAYALGRKLEASDTQVVDDIVQATLPTGAHFNDVVLGIVNSAPFRMRKAREISVTQDQTP